MKVSKKKYTSSFKENLIKRGEEARKVRKVAFIIILVLSLILIIGTFSSYLYIKSALEPVEPNSEEEVEVEIPLGSSSSSIAAILAENGIIKNDIIFRIYTKLKNESDFQAGNYLLSPSMSLDEIIENLKLGKVVQDPIYRVTIPEGLNIDQIAEIFAEELPFTKEEFLKVVNDRVYIEELISNYSFLSDDILKKGIKFPLEGYLFAATYDYYEEEPNIRSIIEEMLAQTQNIVQPYVNEIEEKELTIHEALTFASLVEKEANEEEQRKPIAGIFYNRLEEGMRLQTDPTVAYAIGEHLETTLKEHLDTDSPYNTYQINGLPIGPISNFSKSSLEAVVQPMETDYLYFLHDKKGEIHYAKTNDEHNENRNKYLN